MCGRFALYAKENEIVSHFSLSAGFSMRPRYNIAPAQVIPVVRKWCHPIDFFRWGLIPSWEKGGASLPTGYINARIESVAIKPAFKRIFATQRCIIPASGYYEWRTVGRRKQPYYLSFHEQAVLGLAGIWSTWQDQIGHEYMTCAILTHEAPENLKSYHERMPVILEKAAYSTWLSSLFLSLEEAKKLFLNSLLLEKIGVHAVTPRMNHVNFEGAECILPL